MKTCLFLLLMVVVAPVYSQALCPLLPELEIKRELVVGTKFAPPFMIEKQNSKIGWEGISHDLWSFIASCLQVRYQYKEYPDVTRLLDAVKNGEVDLALSAIDLTSEREQSIDFSYPYFKSNMGVLTLENSGLSSFQQILKNLPAKRILEITAILIAITLTLALIYWHVEKRKENPFFQTGPLKGLYNALLWSVLLVFSGSANPYSIHTRFGQFFVVLFMFFGVTIISSLTAVITSSITVHSLGSEITSASDLKGKRIAILDTANSPADKWLKEEANIKNATTIRSWPQVQFDLESSNIDVMFHDKEIMQYLVNSGYLHNVKVLPINFNEKYYAIALPPNSPLRKPINISLLHHTESTLWDVQQQKHLGN